MGKYDDAVKKLDPVVHLKMDDRGQMFASVATIRAATFDVIDAGCTCDSGEVHHPWELDDDPNDPEQTEDIVNAQRTRFADALIKRIAELQSPPHDGVKLENLCDHHKRRVLPAPSANVCVMCEAERKVKTNG